MNERIRVCQWNECISPGIIIIVIETTPIPYIVLVELYRSKIDILYKLRKELLASLPLS